MIIKFDISGRRPDPHEKDRKTRFKRAHISREYNAKSFTHSLQTLFKSPFDTERYLFMHII